MKKVLTLGNATQDIFIIYEDAEDLHLHSNIKNKNQTKSFLLLSKGSKIEISDYCYFVGGGATNTAAGFSKLNFEISTCFKIGNDLPGQFIQEQIKKYNFNSEIIISKDIKTSTSFIIPTQEKDYVGLIYRDKDIYLNLDDIPQYLFNFLDCLYVSSLNFKQNNLVNIIKKAKETNALIAINPGLNQIINNPESIIEALQYCDIFILNYLEAKSFFAQNFNFEDYFSYILNLGPKIAVVTNGTDGVYVSERNKTYYHPSINTNISSTVGAGDAFASAFAGSILSGKTIEQAIQFGVINSTSVIEHLDAKSGLLSFEELHQKSLDIKNLLQVFPLEKN